MSSYTFWSGPFKVNGVPLRRVNQSYVIATSTKVDISGVNVDKFDDKYFKKEAKKKKQKTEGEFFETEKEVCMLNLFSLHTHFSTIILSLILYLVFSVECRKRKHFPRRRKMTKRLWMLPWSRLLKLSQTWRPILVLGFLLGQAWSLMNLFSRCWTTLYFLAFVPKISLWCWFWNIQLKRTCFCFCYI